MKKIVSILLTTLLLVAAGIGVYAVTAVKVGAVKPSELSRLRHRGRRAAS